MVEIFFPEIVFTLGVVAQVLLLVRHKVPLINLLWLFSASLIGCAIGFAQLAQESWMSAYEFFLAAPFFLLSPAIGFVVLVSVFYREHVLPPIREHVLLALTLLIWLFASLQGWLTTPTLYWVIGCLTLPTVLTLVVTSTSVVLSMFLRVMAYCWFLLAIVFIGAQQINQTIVEFYLGTEFVERPALPLFFLAGMSMAYILAHGWYLFEGFMILTGKIEPSEGRKRIAFLSGLYRHDELRLVETVWILLIVSTGYLLVVRGFMGQAAFLSLSLIVVAQAAGRLPRVSAQAT